jgi:hypothetical protein
MCIAVFLVVAPCSPVSGYKRFEGTYHIREDGGDMFARNPHTWRQSLGDYVKSTNFI